MERRNRHDVRVEKQVNRGAGVARFLVLLLAVGGLGYGVITLTGGGGAARAVSAAPTQESSARVQVAAPDVSTSPQPAAVPAQEVLPATDPLTPSPVLLQQGDTGPKVRALQARLRQIGWYAGKVTDTYGRRTTTAVTGFQTKRGLPAPGSVDRPTLKRLKAMTHRPTKAELSNKVSDGSWTTAPLDRRCLTGHVLCIDKTSRTIRWVVDGEVRKTMAVRFGAAYTPTREGVFHIGWKDREHVSKLFGSSMPFAMFFSGGQAVHYSSDFAARGYSGASHGCVNVRDYAGIKWLFGQVNVGDKVVIYWS
ncbi:MAG: L,D-transpeptidase family protein [Propionibacteriales bacterium]|jgi:peptidoglycan hydrolase-like protein with peptidoglycan-binding domain|nr:L,D-transpeptidase family protein [Propionibacteriales bacterium]